MAHTNPDTPKLMHQIAISAQLGLLVLYAVAAANTIARTRIAPPLEVFPAIFAGLGLAAFFLPLLWWRTSAGFVGALVVAGFALAWPLLVLSGAAGELGATVPLSPVGILTYMALPIVLAVSGGLAWRDDRTGFSSSTDRGS